MAIQNKIISFWKQVKLKSSDMFTQFRVGVGVKVPTHKLHVKDSTDPVKIEGVQSDTSSSTKFLVLDGNNVVKHAVGGGKSNEEIQDIVGAMFSSNTETGIVATYEDSDGTIDLVVSGVTDLHTAGVDGAANQLLTDDGDGTVTSEPKLTFEIIDSGGGSVFSQLTLGDDSATPTRIKHKDHSDGVGGIMQINGANSAGTNAAGGKIQLSSGQGTGTGAGGSLEFWAASAGSSGSTANSYGFGPKFSVNSDGDTSITGDLQVTGTIFSTQDYTVFGNDIIFEGTSNDDYEVTLSGGNPGSDITVTLPASTGTLALQNENTTGSAATLTTARAINGVDFDGSAPITITAAGSTLSDTVPVSKGGTGATSFADKAVIITQDSGTDTLAAVAMSTNGQLLIGGTDGPTATTLTQGYGLTITNANGAITLATAGDIDTTGESGTVDNIGNLTGDVTSSNRATTIANDAVTYAKMQNVSATNVVLGRDSAGAGVVEEISAANLRTIINVEDGATADQTQADINGLGITAIGIAGPTDGDVSIVTDGNISVTLDNDNDESNQYFEIRNSATGSVFSIREDGNVTVDGTVDGRDVAADGTKLDGIENGATADQTNVTGSSGSCTGNAATATALTSGDKTIEGNLRLGGTGDTSNNWLSIDAQNGDDSSGGGITFYETGTYDVDSPQYGAKIVYNEDADEFAIGTMHNNVFMRQIYFSRQFARTYFNGDLQIRDSSPSITVIDTSTTVANGDVVGTIGFSNEDDDGTTLRLQAVATEDHASGANGGTKLEIKTTPNGSSTEAVALTVGEDKSLTVEGTIELGHASDTTIARSAAGIATIEGKQIFTTNTPALTSAAAGVPAVTMQIRRTITTGEANALNSTPIELIPAQGANTVIVLAGGIIRIDRAATQTNAAADMNFHYEGLEPGTFAQTSLFHARRFMYNETGDRVYNIIPGMSAYEVAQSLTQDVNKAVEVSVDSALTSNCITSMDIYLTYHVFNIS